jgi:hypothetical protein
VIADVCPWCAGGSRHSDWRPYCSAGCEYNGALNAVLADGEARGAAAERAAVVAWLRANVAQRVLSLHDTIACIERGEHCNGA